MTTNVTFSWPQLIWSAIGAAVVMGTLLGRRWLVNRRRKERNERPPQKTKLLRPAAHSSMCKVDEAFEKLISALMQALGSGVMFGLSFGPIAPVIWGLLLRRFSLAQLAAVPKSYLLLFPLVIMLAALVWSIRMSRLVFKYEDETRNWRLGARGEQAVAESLADPKLAAAGYKAFHDVEGDGEWNIDHVLVGPGGVFVVETKACVRRKSKSGQPDHTVIYDGKTLRFPWRVEDGAVGQVEANARWVREKIARYAPKNILVQPVIVVPGWWVESQGDFPVKAMNAKYLVNYLASVKQRFTSERSMP